MAKKHFEVSKGLLIKPQTSAPSDPVEGDLYFDSTLDKFRRYEGGLWKDFLGNNTNRLIGGDSGEGSVANIVVGSYSVTNVSFNAGADEVIYSPNGYFIPVGTRVRFSGSPGAPLTTGTDYFVQTSGSNFVKVSATLGGAAIDITGAGGGSENMYLVDGPPAVSTATLPSTSALAIAINTSSPITTNSDFLATATSSNVGDYLAWPFTIDLSERAEVLSVRFKYKMSASSSNGSYNVYVRDLTNNTIIPVTPSLLQYTGLAADFSGVFQSSYNSVSYRLEIVRIGTSPLTYTDTLNINKLEVSKNATVNGPAVTDWTAYTPTFTGFGIATGIDCWYARSGGDLLLRCKWSSGTNTGTEARVSLPPGLTSDSLKILSIQKCGDLAYSGSANESLHVLVESGVSYVTFGAQAGGGLSKVNGNAFGNTTTNSFIARIPIQAWSSSQILSSEEDGRICAMRASSSTARSIGTATPMIFETVSSDTHGAYNSSTGRYTMKLPGFYSINAMLPIAGGSSGQAISIYKNGSPLQSGSSTTGNTGNANTSVVSASGVFLLAGDIIDIRGNTSFTTIASNPDKATFSISRSSGTSQIAATESISASYYLSANFAATTTVPINFDTKIWDSHGAVTTSATAWRFTAPIAGEYEISMMNPVVNGSTFVYKNGAIYLVLAYDNGSYIVSAPTSVKLLAGEYIDLRPNANLTYPGGTSTTNTTARITVKRTGNY